MILTELCHCPQRAELAPGADLGILHGAEFQGLQWDINSQRAALGDVLRVHEWSYVDLLQKASASCTGESKFGALDSDTIISAGSFRAALAAAGAVTAAVDKVMAKQVRPLRLCRRAAILFKLACRPQAVLAMR